MPETRPGGPPGSTQGRLYSVIFEHDTRPGKLFDVALLVAIVASVAVVMLDSVAPIRSEYAVELRALEWFFTVLFTIEYVARLWVVKRAGNYATSFFGVVDVLAILPSYLSVLWPGGQALAVVRILRVLRVFRILKLAHFVGEANTLGAALRASSRKIIVFMLSVVSIVVIVGALMYFVEAGGGGFTSIPKGVYWAVVTLTTVGYGDIAPETGIGQFLASLVMILGYAIIAVPTGIVTAELGRQPPSASGRTCAVCGHMEGDAGARFCRYCSEPFSDLPISG